MGNVTNESSLLTRAKILLTSLRPRICAVVLVFYSPLLVSGDKPAPNLPTEIIFNTSQCTSTLTRIVCDMYVTSLSQQPVSYTHLTLPTTPYV